MTKSEYVDDRPLVDVATIRLVHGSRRVRCPFCAAPTGDPCATAAGKELRAMHAARRNSTRDHMRGSEFFAAIKRSDPRFGLNTGDVVRCIGYLYDAKATVLRRESDGFNPECNQYLPNLRFLRFVDESI